MPSRATGWIGLLCVGAMPLIQGCSSGASGFERRVDRIEDLTRSRDYVDAAEASVKLLKDTPQSSKRYPAAVEAQRGVSLASQLDRARWLSLNRYDDEALALLAELHTEFPESKEVVAWQQHTRRKLSDKWFVVARESLASQNYVAARAAYKNVLKYEPDHPVAGLSLEDLQRLEEYRDEMGDKYYNGGIREMVGNRLSGARGSFEKTLKYDTDNAKAERRISEVDRQRAIARAGSAMELGKRGLYAAAALDYTEAARLDPESEDIQEKLAAMRSEKKSYALRLDAEYMVLRGDINRAEELLEEGAALTKLQTEAFDAARKRIAEARLESQYQAALDMEHDFRFEDAIRAYKELLLSRDFYKDTRARIDALMGYMDSAARIYAEAEDETSEEKRLELLQQIDLFWPEYKDVAVKIRALKQ